MDYIAIANQFDIEGTVISAEPFGNGLINSTILVTTDRAKYILQKINTAVFPDTEGLMDNIVRVTNHLRGKIAAQGGDILRQVLTPVAAKNGGWLFENRRMYRFIDGCVSIEKAENADQFFETGRTFGEFQLMLQDFPAHTLCEVIPDFHNTPKRVEKFEQAVEKGISDRVSECENEIAALLSRKDKAGIIMSALADGSIPLRVTHNDTKLNNVMLDERTLKGVCVVDLDTVMPGSALFDIGDAIRTGAALTAEDDADFDKAGIDVELFKAFVDGFSDGMAGTLTENECKLIVRGVWTIVYEQAVRFLTDYLEGDIYYGIKYEKHNLVRAKNQIALMLDIERKWDEMESAIVREIN